MTAPLKPLTPQELAIAAELRSRGAHGLTPLEALNDGLGFRLGARIFALRAHGYTIDTLRAVTPGGATVARYVLTPEPAATFAPTTGVQEGLPL